MIVRLWTLSEILVTAQIERASLAYVGVYRFVIRLFELVQLHFLQDALLWVEESRDVLDVLRTDLKWLFLASL